MNITNILLTACAILALAACSKDDRKVPVSELPDAKMNILLHASGPGGSLKAEEIDPEALPGEMYINSITVLSFLADGSAILSDPYYTTLSSTDGTASVLNVPTKATKAMVVILANVPQNAFSGVATYTDFQVKLAQLSDQQQENLAMSCRIITSDNDLSAGDNYLGYASETNINKDYNTPIELTRLAARVELKSVAVNFRGTDLANRTVRINKVYLRNVKTTSHYASTAYWGAIMANGEVSNSAEVLFTQNVTDGNPLSYPGFRQYVMENTDAAKATEVVVNASILYNGTYKEQTKNFVAVINANGINKPDVKHNYVRRNYIYRLSISFGANSFENVPDDGDPTPTPPPAEPGNLMVAVDVVGWGPISQDVVVGD